MFKDDFTTSGDSLRRACLNWFSSSVGKRLATKLSAWFTGSWSVTVEELQHWEGQGEAEKMEEAGHENAEMIHPPMI